MTWNRIIKILVGFATLVTTTIVLSIIFLPNKLFTDDYSTVILDRNNNILGAKLADDEQWRFRPVDSVPQKFKTAIITFEDIYFYSHPGINPISIISALNDNIKANKIIRGGSTISMQVMRLSRAGKARTFKQKIIEIFLTIGLEIKYSKDEILNLYCSNAPFGGNIVGLNAASWRYFGHADHELSWAEAATLAVLPNAPSIIHMGRNRGKLKLKRDKLLLKLLSSKNIDSTQYLLALLEEIPGKVKPLPYIAPHLVEHIARKFKGEIIKTTIDYDMQLRVKQIAQYHTGALLQNGINNAAVLVVSPESKEVLVYLGNLSTSGHQLIMEQYNDMVMATRSSGSILKPFLYAAMNFDGLILPNSLVRDIPSYFNDYHPENYNSEFQGAVPASKALSQSLNVPAVYMLQSYGTTRFLNLLKKLGFSSLVNSASHYGLSLILGGGEVSLFELVNAYAGMAAILISYDKNYGEYPLNAYGNLKLTFNKNALSENEKNANGKPLSAASIWLTYKALKNVSRPETEIGWENYSSSKKVAWKTGTSHGFKDAWAVGTTANYVVGVWAGNANGEGRNGLTGTKVAAPIMFDIFNILETSDEFYPPYDELIEISVCKQSGNLTSLYCPEIQNILVDLVGAEAKVCTYHKTIFTDEKEEFRLSQKCTSILNLKPVAWFVLPPIQEYYYKKKHPGYKTLPPFAIGCGSDSDSHEIDFIYPVKNSIIYVATDETEQERDIIFEISHHNPSTNIYWHLDNQLIGITKNTHQLEYIPVNGIHKLTVVDENGYSASVNFTIVR